MKKLRESLTEDIRDPGPPRQYARRISRDHLMDDGYDPYFLDNREDEGYKFYQIRDDEGTEGAIPGVHVPTGVNEFWWKPGSYAVDGFSSDTWDGFIAEVEDFFGQSPGEQPYGADEDEVNEDVRDTGPPADAARPVGREEVLEKYDVLEEREVDELLFSGFKFYITNDWESLLIWWRPGWYETIFDVTLSAITWTLFLAEIEAYHAGALPQPYDPDEDEINESGPGYEGKYAYEGEVAVILSGDPDYGEWAAHIYEYSDDFIDPFEEGGWLDEFTSRYIRTSRLFNDNREGLAEKVLRRYPNPRRLVGSWSRADHYRVTASNFYVMMERVSDTFPEPGYGAIEQPYDDDEDQVKEATQPLTFTALLRRADHVSITVISRQGEELATFESLGSITRMADRVEDRFNVRLLRDEHTGLFHAVPEGQLADVIMDIILGLKNEQPYESDEDELTEAAEPESSPPAGLTSQISDLRMVVFHEFPEDWIEDMVADGYQFYETSEIQTAVAEDVYFWWKPGSYGTEIEGVEVDETTFEDFLDSLEQGLLHARTAMYQPYEDDEDQVNELFGWKKAVHRPKPYILEIIEYSAPWEGALATPAQWGIRIFEITDYHRSEWHEISSTYWTADLETSLRHTIDECMIKDANGDLYCGIGFVRDSFPDWNDDQMLFRNELIEVADVDELMRVAMTFEDRFMNPPNPFAVPYDDDEDQVKEAVEDPGPPRDLCHQIEDPLNNELVDFIPKSEIRELLADGFTFWETENGWDQNPIVFWWRPHYYQTVFAWRMGAYTWETFIASLDQYLGGEPETPYDEDEDQVKEALTLRSSLTRLLL